MKKNKGFANSYFEHYYYFDSKKTPYEKCNDPYSISIVDSMYRSYNTLNGNVPTTYVETGCGNGKFLNRMLQLGLKSSNVVGCDFSDYFNGSIICPKENFVKMDSISFIKNINYPIDMCYENSLQYLDIEDFVTLISLLSKKMKYGSVLGVLYDESVRYHPYRKICKSVQWWKETLELFGFRNFRTQYLFYRIKD